MPFDCPFPLAACFGTDFGIGPFHLLWCSKIAPFHLQLDPATTLLLMITAPLLPDAALPAPGVQADAVLPAPLLDAVLLLPDVRQLPWAP